MAAFEQLVHVLRRLKSPSEVGGALYGSLEVDSEETLAQLTACLGDPENTGLSLADDVVATPKLGDEVNLQLQTPRLSFGLVRKDLEALLRSPRAHVQEPAQYFLWEPGFLRSDPVKLDGAMDRYRKVLAFVQLLKGSAAFLDEQEEVLVFIRSGKFELPVKYKVADLEAADISLIDKLIAAIPDGAHKAQGQAILSEALHEVVAQHEAPVRFGKLLRGIADVYERFDRGYRLFAAGFSYEKLRDQVEAARIEFTGKMHKVFSDIQNQLLGIPVATVIVATQMKPHDRIGTEFWISLAVLVGSFVFAGLVHLLLRNQRHTLEVVGIEINRQRKELERQPDGVVANLLPTFELLDRRYLAQMRVLRAIDLVVLGGAALSVFFFYQLSGPAKRWVDAWLLQLL